MSVGEVNEKSLSDSSHSRNHPIVWLYSARGWLLSLHPHGAAIAAGLVAQLCNPATGIQTTFTPARNYCTGPYDTSWLWGARPGYNCHELGWFSRQHWWQNPWIGQALLGTCSNHALWEMLPLCESEFKSQWEGFPPTFTTDPVFPVQSEKWQITGLCRTGYKVSIMYTQLTRI